MRLLTGWVWDFFQADRSEGFLAWFSDHWVKLAFILIILGAVADWLIWMIRWRPYWLWLRKRQIIYEEAPARRRTPARKKRAGEKAAFYDPFAENEEDPYAPDNTSGGTNLFDWDASEDPYADKSGDKDKN